MTVQTILTVQVQAENYEQYASYLRTLVETAICTELAKEKHKLGEVRVNVWKQSPLDQAIWNLAERIKETASSAVDERIH
jgi:hypothetical protein